MRRRALLLAALGLALLAAAWVNPLASTAARYNQEASVAAVAIYATLRSLSAVISVLKDADVEGSVVVTSITVSPGQVLEPLTQTLERFADIMFVVALVSGTLALLLGSASSTGGLVAGAALLAGAVLLATRRTAGLPPGVIQAWRALVGIGLSLAVVFPLAYSLAFWWGDGLTREATARAMAVLEGAAPESVEAPEVDRSTLEQVQAFMTKATDVLQATIDLSVAYLLKLVVLPVLLTLAVWWLARSFRSGGTIVVRSPPDHR